MVKAPVRRELVRHLAGRGLSERHALRVIGMSASAYRYQPAPDCNLALREEILALAHRHRRYGAGMIYLKLRQAGQLVNHKRVDRLATRIQRGEAEEIAGWADAFRIRHLPDLRRIVEERDQPRPVAPP